MTSDPFASLGTSSPAPTAAPTPGASRDPFASLGVTPTPAPTPPPSMANLGGAPLLAPTLNGSAPLMPTPMSALPPTVSPLAIKSSLPLTSPPVAPKAPTMASTYGVPGAVAMTAFPSTLKTIADIQTNPASLGSSFKDILSTPQNDVNNAATGLGTALKNFKDSITGNASLSQKIGTGLSALAAGGGFALSPISGFFDAASKIPLIGTIAKLAINVPFAAVGDAAGDMGSGIVNALPISKQAKNNISSGVRAIFSLAGQIGVGGEIAPDVLGTLKETFGPADAATILAKAQELAQEKAVGSIGNQADLPAQAPDAAQIAADQPAQKPQSEAEVNAQAPVEPAPSFLPKVPLSTPAGGTVDLSGRNTGEPFSDIAAKPTMFDSVVNKLSQPKINPVQDITPPVPSDLAEKAHQLTMETGGSTLDLAGNTPIKGIAYAPSKATEFSIEQEKYTPALYDQYVQAHMDELSQPGKHIGTWIDNGKVYFDVIEVGDKTPATLEKAQNAEQLGVFDLGTHETIPLGTMENGVYTKLNGTTSNIDNLDSGKNPSANSDGGKIGVSEVPNDVSKVAGSGNDNGAKAGGAGENKPVEAGSKANGNAEGPVNADGSPAKTAEPSATDSGVKTSKIAESIKAKAIEAGITKDFGKLASYDPTTVRAQAEKISDLMTNDMNRARAIVRGELPIPDKMSSTYLIKAMEDYATETRNGEMIKELAQSPLTSETSVHAQELRMAGERDPDSPVEKAKEIQAAREKSAATTAGKTVEEATNDAVKDVQTKTARPAKVDWATFIQSIQC